MPYILHVKTLYLSIIVIVISFGTYYAFAQNPAMPYSGPSNDLGDGNFLVMQTAKGSYLGGDIIEITGNAPLKSNVKIILTDPNGTTSDSAITFSDRNGYFTAQLKMPKDAYGGIWKIVGTSGIYQRELNIDVFAADEAHTTHCCLISNYTKPVVILPPLKQFSSGIAANDVKCQQDLQLVIKSEDGSPACVTQQTAQKFVERGWGWAMQTIGSLKRLLPNKIPGFENDTGIVTLGNHTYYFETPNYTNTAYSNPVQISFHDVLFTLFPAGFRGGLPTSVGCGNITVGEIITGSGSYYWTDAKFLDGTRELLHIFAVSPLCPENPTPTYFSNHTNPQAGLTFYDGKMKLLVSADNQSSSALRLVLSTNSTTIQSGQVIGIDISLNNTSSKPLTLAAQDHWPINGIGLGGCSFLPIGIVIVDGYYTEYNMTDAKSLSLYFLPPCPPGPGMIKSFTFQPMSNQITVECESTNSPVPCPQMTEARANVAYSSFLENEHFLNFNTGIYTIIGGDEWGHIAIQHFTVTNSTR